MFRSFDARNFPATRLLAAKKGRRVSVCLPARNEEETIGEMVATICAELMDRYPVVDEVLVVDDGSTDSTATEAAAGGARVVSAAEVLPEYGSEHGKGQAMWRGVHETSGDLIVFCDADIRGFDPGFVLGLLGPLLTRDDIDFVKGYYERPLDGRPGEGGRVTELMARPLISVFFPHLAELAQPLSGECAAPRRVLESIPFVGGYGVDLGLLIDVTERFGTSGVVQCDLGERVHRNRSLSDLGVQALSILQASLQRAGRSPADVTDFPWTSRLVRPSEEPISVSFAERPPLVQVPAYRKTA